MAYSRSLDVGIDNDLASSSDSFDHIAVVCSTFALTLIVFHAVNQNVNVYSLLVCTTVLYCCEINAQKKEYLVG